MSRLPAEWRRIIVCPRCRGALRDEANALCCDACALRYPFINGIPSLLAEAAQPLEPLQPPAQASGASPPRRATR